MLTAADDTFNKHQTIQNFGWSRSASAVIAAGVGAALALTGDDRIAMTTERRHTPVRAVELRASPSGCGWLWRSVRAMAEAQPRHHGHRRAPRVRRGAPACSVPHVVFPSELRRSLRAARRRDHHRARPGSRRSARRSRHHLAPARARRAQPRRRRAHRGRSRQPQRNLGRRRARDGEPRALVTGSACASATRC